MSSGTTVKSAKKNPFCYLIFTAALFFFSIQNNPRLLSAFSRKSAYIDVYFYKMQHGSDKGNNREHIHLFCVAAIDLFHIWGVKTFQLFQRESDQAIIHCLRLFSYGVFSCLFDLRSNEQYSSLTWQTFRRNYSAVSFDLFVWLLPEISWF